MGAFKNKNYQDSFDEKGYIVIPFLSEDVIASAMSFYKDQLTENANPHPNFNAVNNSDKNNYIAETTAKLIAPLLDSVFTEYVNNGPTFLVKNTSHGEYRMHQDGTLVVDDSGFACYIWMPLQDVNQQNGCMVVLDGSHLFFKNITSFTYQNEPIPIKEVAPQFIKKLELKKGEALFFHPRLFHGSYQNNTNNPRVVLHTLITSPGQPLIFYQRKDDYTASEFLVTAESYRNSHERYCAGFLPDGAIFSRDIPYAHIPVDQKLLNEKCAEAAPKISLITRMKNMLSSK